MQNYLKLLVLSAFSFLYGCKDSATSPGVTGSMVGYVVAIDSTGTNRDNTGVKISIDGTNYSAMSDSSGRWEMTNVLPGTYNISFTKNNYATEKMIAYRFVGNGTDYLFSQNIYQIMWTQATLVLRPFDSGKTIFSCRLFRTDSTQSLGGACMILFGKNNSLSPEDPNSYLYERNNFPYSYWGPSDSISFDNILGYSLAMDSSKLYRAGFRHNDKIYCQAFVGNLLIDEKYDMFTNPIIFGPSYIDIASGKRIYTGFGNNHSEVRYFVLP